MKPHAALFALAVFAAAAVHAGSPAWAELVLAVVAEGRVRIEAVPIDPFGIDGVTSAYATGTGRLLWSGAFYVHGAIFCDDGQTVLVPSNLDDVNALPDSTPVLRIYVGGRETAVVRLGKLRPFSATRFAGRISTDLLFASRSLARIGVDADCQTYQLVTWRGDGYVISVPSGRVIERFHDHEALDFWQTMDVRY